MAMLCNDVSVYGLKNCSPSLSKTVAFFISSSTVSLAQQHVVPDMIDHKSLLQLFINYYYLIIFFTLQRVQLR